MKISKTTLPTNTDLQSEFQNIFENLFFKNSVPAFIKVLQLEASKADDIYADLHKIHSQFKTAKEVFVFGVGGSSLGGLTLADVFRASHKVRFFENVDAFDFFSNLYEIKNFEECHFIIISKSGSTLETLAQMNFLIQYLQSKKISFHDKCVVITEEKPSPLLDWAQSQRVPVLAIPLDLGGRFSVLSSVGLYPALFMGIDIYKLREGACAALNLKAEAIEFCSQIASSLQRKEMITVFWSYSEALKKFGLWIQQLWSESLGKEKNLAGQKAPYASTPLPLTGTNDQHSVLQQIMEGQRDKFIVFLRSHKAENFGDSLKNSQFVHQNFLVQKKLGDILKAQYVGTQTALAEKGVPSLTLELTDLDEKNVGQLLVFFQMCVAMLGKYHNINTYDQPGVEFSKKIAVDQLKSESI